MKRLTRKNKQKYNTANLKSKTVTKKHSGGSSVSGGVSGGNLENGGNKTWKTKSCSPIVENATVSHETCYTPRDIIAVKNSYNNAHPTNKIEEKEPEKIIKELKEEIKNCNNEMCWLDEIKNPQLKKELTEKSFAPKHPEKWNSSPNEWLSNIDISKVINQYEKKYKNFKFIGPSAIDFDTVLGDNKCVNQDLCKIDLKHYIQHRKNKIGVIFNLDKHDQSGSHWVAMFIDLEHKFFFYFDSANNLIPPEIKNLTNKIHKQSKDLGLHLKYYDNQNITHQQSNTECGMYSLFFIVTMLTGKVHFNKQSTLFNKTKHKTKYFSVKGRISLFKHQRIPDKYVEKYRKIYFNS